MSQHAAEAELEQKGRVFCQLLVVAAIVRRAAVRSGGWGLKAQMSRAPLSGEQICHANVRQPLRTAACCDFAFCCSCAAMPMDLLIR